MKWMKMAILLLMMTAFLGAPAVNAPTGLTPLSVSGAVACDLFCVDVWEVKCNQPSKFMHIFMHDDFCVEDTFLGIMVGLSPTGLYGKADSDTNSGCTDGFIELIRPTSIDGTMKGLFTITTLPGSDVFKDYILEFDCHNHLGAFKAGSILLKDNQ